ncbi:MAG: hypothetical protein ABMB14_22705 [Myxococcota bacterium]
MERQVEAIDGDRFETTVGEWVAALYDTLIEEYGDEELAEVAAAVIVHDRLADDDRFDDVW